MKTQATLDLLSRTARTFRHAWSQRAALDGISRQSHEAAFLPAALSLQETPVHPAPRIAMGLILLFAAIALAWAMFGSIDIVASAQGKLIPDSRSKVVQPMKTVPVGAIHVRDRPPENAAETCTQHGSAEAGGRRENGLHLADAGRDQTVKLRRVRPATCRWRAARSSGPCR
jgi:hemolysin D